MTNRVEQYISEERKLSFLEYESPSWLYQQTVLLNLWNGLTQEQKEALINIKAGNSELLEECDSKPEQR